MSVRAVCFDLDDTLYDYREYAAAGLRSAADRLEALTGESHHEELHELYFDVGITDGTFDTLLARHDLPASLADELVEAYHDASCPLDPYDDAETVLSALSATHDLALITDGRGGEAKLRRLGVGDYFSVVLVTHAVGRSKREAPVFEQVLADLSTSPADAAYVGDDPRVDFRLPNELGMTTVRLRRGRYADRPPTDATSVPDHEIAGLSELPALFSSQ